jgi:hypothetical protein
VVLASLLFLLFLLSSLWWGPSVWGDDLDLPDWLETVLRGAALVAFAAIVALPLLHLLRGMRKRQWSKPLLVTAWLTIGGYLLLFAQLLYVKLKTCDPDAIPHDDSWYCQYDGKHAVVYFVLIPIFAAIVGMVFAGLERLNQKR